MKPLNPRNLMMKALASLLLALSCLTLSGCATSGYEAKYPLCSVAPAGLFGCVHGKS
ncbi:hypothetical protein JKG47_04760 [Acidithiobacillus sp. MC6.1]|nr:hypothetical protein [Acidithiobacillus sp. MC6.1]